MTARYPFDPDWVVAPGATLADWFEETGVPRKVASRYGLDRDVLDRLIAGDEPITPELAQTLCNLTHIGAPMWLALEHNYRVGLAAGKKRAA